MDVTPGDVAVARRVPWRQGRSVGRTIYNADDVLIGVMDTPFLAGLVVDCVNSMIDPGTMSYT